MRWGREGVLVTHCSAFLSQCLTLCAAFDTIFSDTIIFVNSLHLGRTGSHLDRPLHTTKGRVIE